MERRFNDDHTIRFLPHSSHRVQALQGNIEIEILNASHQRLEVLCPTRWVERHDSIIIILEPFPAIVKTLEDLQDKMPQVSSKATNILNSIEKSSFVACCVIEKLAESILPLLKMLQIKQLDMFSTDELMDSVQLVLHNDRKNGEDSFKQIRTKVKNLCQKHEIVLIILRRDNHQYYREKYPVNDVESYFRQSIYVPYAEHLLVQMSERLEDQT